MKSPEIPTVPERVDMRLEHIVVDKHQGQCIINPNSGNSSQQRGVASANALYRGAAWMVSFVTDAY